MKSLVVYYSNTGNTRHIADLISYGLSSDVAEIKEEKNRANEFSLYFLGSIEAILNLKSKIKPITKDYSKYDLVLIGSPVWAGHIPPAVRTFVEENKINFKNYAIFSTSGSGEDSKKAFSQISGAIGREPFAVLSFSSKELTEKKEIPAVERFLKKLR